MKKIPVELFVFIGFVISAGLIVAFPSKWVALGVGLPWVGLLLYEAYKADILIIRLYKKRNERIIKELERVEQLKKEISKHKTLG